MGKPDVLVIDDQRTFRFPAVYARTAAEGMSRLNEQQWRDVWPRFNMHTMAGLMNGWRVEFQLGMKYVEDQIFVDPPQPDPRTNSVRIPTGGGLGMELNRDNLRDSRVSGGG